MLQGPRRELQKLCHMLQRHSQLLLTVQYVQETKASPSHCCGSSILLTFEPQVRPQRLGNSIVQNYMYNIDIDIEILHHPTQIANHHAATQLS